MKGGAMHKISMFDHYKAIGIKAYTDGYSYDQYGYIYLVSILGPDSSVKGLSSAIVSLRDVTIDLDDDYEVSVCAMPGEKYRILSARLDCGLLHQIVVMESLISQKANTKLVYIGDEKETSNTIFNMIKKNFGTPLLPEWKDWLIRQIKNEELIDVMQGNIQLARVNIKEKQLDSIISDGVRAKRIGF